VTIPVVANGDLLRAEDAPDMLEASGADAVMIGRGAYGQPWIVAQAGAVLAGQTPPMAPVGDALRVFVLEHYEMILTHYGIAKGVRIARKHLGWYLDRLKISVPAVLRGALLQADDPRAVKRLLISAFAHPVEAAAA
jgi:tRNA-dihydrouridine synthase B